MSGNLNLHTQRQVLSNKVGISQTIEMALDAKRPKGMNYLLNKVAPMPPCLSKFSHHLIIMWDLSSIWVVSQVSFRKCLSPSSIPKLENPEGIQINQSIIIQDRANGYLFYQSNYCLVWVFNSVKPLQKARSGFHEIYFINLVIILNICCLEQGCQVSRLKILIHDYYPITNHRW